MIAGRERGASSRGCALFELELQDRLPNELANAEQPAVFSLSLLARGVPLGGAMLVRSSGSEAADAAALQWLRRPKTLAQLPVGLLEIRVFL